MLGLADSAMGINDDMCPRGEGLKNRPWVPIDPSTPNVHHGTDHRDCFAIKTSLRGSAIFSFGNAQSKSTKIQKYSGKSQIMVKYVTTLRERRGSHA